MTMVNLTYMIVVMFIDLYKSILLKKNIERG